VHLAHIESYQIATRSNVGTGSGCSRAYETHVQPASNCRWWFNQNAKEEKYFGLIQTRRRHHSGESTLGGEPGAFAPPEDQRVPCHSGSSRGPFLFRRHDPCQRLRQRLLRRSIGWRSANASASCSASQVSTSDGRLSRYRTWLEEFKVGQDLKSSQTSSVLNPASSRVENC
jgi:hypothetical protein